ncbi:MAG TPA: sigma-54 dependent transcriptional regulator [Thermoanaerobaculia bacterium]|nr:sigma-54 dependent transcriptional regulator [Thermoanaerobaculia bacterium]
MIVDDDADVAAGLDALLQHSGWVTETAATGREALQLFERFSPDVVLLDVMLPDRSGLEILDAIKSYSESTPVIMMSGVATISSAVEAMRLGAETFLSKPCDAETLELVLHQAERSIETRRELAALKRAAPPVESRFPGISRAAGEINDLIGRIAAASSPVLLEGESGSGKGFVARIIHRRSPRARRPFVDLNCAGLPRELLESELFGHERGAFTDAVATKAGLLEIASGGSLFLDEIGEMEPSIQARLLKVLEDKQFRRVGGLRDIASDFRLIAASNRDLDADVAGGRFRRDLFYRLNVIRIRIPPLRERREDIPLLSEKFIDELSRELRMHPPSLSPRALERLAEHHWPGNVRELRNVLERALLVSTGKELRAEDLLPGETLALGEEVRSTAARPQAEADIRPLDEIVRDYIRGAVDATGGNVRAAARKLRISPSTLYARMKE